MFIKNPETIYFWRSFVIQEKLISSFFLTFSHRRICPHLSMDEEALAKEVWILWDVFTLLRELPDRWWQYLCFVIENGNISYIVFCSKCILGSCVHSDSLKYNNSAQYTVTSKTPNSFSSLNSFLIPTQKLNNTRHGWLFLYFHMFYNIITHRFLRCINSVQLNWVNAHVAQQ